MAAVRRPEVAEGSSSGAGSISGIFDGVRGGSAGWTNARCGTPGPPAAATCSASGSPAGDPGDGFEPGGGVNSRGCGLGSAPACGRSTRAVVLAPTLGAAGTAGSGPGVRRASRGGVNGFGLGFGNTSGGGRVSFAVVVVTFGASGTVGAGVEARRASRGAT